jgi:hypothetical protein
MQSHVASIRLTVACIFQLHFSAESALEALPTAQANALHIDLGTVEERIKQGVPAQRANEMDKHWSRWDALCVAHNVDPYLKTWADPVPILQVFGERYRDGRLSPRKKTLELALWKTASAPLARRMPDWGAWGGADPRKDSHGGIDFRIQRQIKAYTKEDSPPRRVKPVPVIIIVFIMAQAFGDTRTDAEMAIADMITITFFCCFSPANTPAPCPMLQRSK